MNVTAMKATASETGRNFQWPWVAAVIERRGAIVTRTTLREYATHEEAIAAAEAWIAKRNPNT